MRRGPLDPSLAALVLLFSLVPAAFGQPAAPAGRAADRQRADALLEAAGGEADLGQYDAARRHAQEAAALYEALGDLAAVGKARNRAGLASIYAGDYALAQQSLDAAIDASRRAGDTEGLAEEVGNRANVDFFTGRYTDAAARYQQALLLTNASPPGAGSRWVARRRRILAANQASLYQRLGRYQEALEVYEELARDADTLAPSEAAQLLVNEGALYRRLGDPQKALATYDRALQLFRRDRNVDGELGAIKNRGIVLAQDLGRADLGTAAFAAALATATTAGNQREMLHARLYRGEALLRSGDAPSARADFTAAVALARSLKTPEEEWKGLYGLGRTEGTRDGAAAQFREAVGTIEKIRGELRVPSLRPDFLNDKRDVYDALLAARLPAGDAGEVFAVLEQAHSRDWRDRLGLAARVRLADVQARLGDGVLLLDYWNSAAGSAVVAVTRLRVQVLPLTIDVAAAKRLIDSLAAGDAREWRADAAALAQLLPPRDWFDGIRHVIVVPDGAVALVPFEVLPVADRLLVERAPVSYLPTAAALLAPGTSATERRAALAPRWRWPWQTVLEAFGDPQAPPPHPVLPGTRDEIARVAAQLSGRVLPHLGADDRKRHLEEERRRPPLLHIAAHAFADTSALEQSRILFSPKAAGGAADYLYLREAYSLPLGGVQLAVLSACDTERGTYLRGEGVQSFSRAFLAAGAASTVTTLWRVADQPTADFMASFYYHLQRGAARDQALQRAKLRFLASGTSLAHPHYWAAFVLTGEGTRPVATAVSWTTLAAAAAAAAALTGAGLLLARASVRRGTASVSATRPR